MLGRDEGRGRVREAPRAVVSGACDRSTASTAYFTATKGMDGQTVHPRGHHHLHPARERRVHLLLPAAEDGRMTRDARIGTWIAALLTLCASFVPLQGQPFLPVRREPLRGRLAGLLRRDRAEPDPVPNLFVPLREDFARTRTCWCAGSWGCSSTCATCPRSAGSRGTRSRSTWPTTSESSSRAGSTARSCRRWRRRSSRPGRSRLGRRFCLAVFDAIVGSYSVLIYFFFSKEQGPVTGRIARVGIWFLMISFGAAFGFTVMGRVALLHRAAQLPDLELVVSRSLGSLSRSAPRLRASPLSASVSSRSTAVRRRPDPPFSPPPTP